jgi:hypothetical protein
MWYVAVESSWEFGNRQMTSVLLPLSLTVAPMLLLRRPVLLSLVRLLRLLVPPIKGRVVCARRRRGRRLRRSPGCRPSRSLGSSVRLRIVRGGVGGLLGRG